MEMLRINELSLAPARGNGGSPPPGRPDGADSLRDGRRRSVERKGLFGLLSLGLNRFQSAGRVHIVVVPSPVIDPARLSTLIGEYLP
jgi:hypothetical protein